MVLVIGPAASAKPSDPKHAACIVETEATANPKNTSQEPSSTNETEANPPSNPPRTDTSPPTNSVEGSSFTPAPLGGQPPTLIPSIPNTPNIANPPPSNLQSPALPETNGASSPPEPASQDPSTNPSAGLPSSVRVNQIQVVGSTVYNDDKFNPIIQPLQGGTVTLQELQKAADQITELYVRDGYITSFAQLDNESLKTGAIRIQVIEGSIAEIRVRGLRRLNPEYVCSRLRFATDAPVNANRLEEKLRLLKIDPLFNDVEAILQRPDTENSEFQSTDRQGQSILRIQVVEANPIEFGASFDNHLPSTIAPEEATIGVRHRDLTGFGDELAFSYSVGVNITDFPRAALNLYDLTYRLPLNPNEGTLQLRAVYSTSAVTDPEFDQFDFRGTAEYYDVTYRQPIIRSLREELALSLGFTLQNSQTFIFQNNPRAFEEGPDNNGFSRTRVIRFGQDYIRRDSRGAWGIQSQFNFGLDIFDATRNSGSIPDGQFFSWQGQFARFQELGNDYRLIVRGGLQLTPNPLLSIQQFYLGGASSLRGYPPNSRKGDNGLYLGVEGRIPVFRDQRGSPIFQIAPFAELGYVWNDPGNPNFLDDPNFLSDVGLSFIYEPITNLSFQLDVALPLVEFAGRRNYAQDNGVYFSINYNF